MFHGIGCCVIIIPVHRNSLVPAEFYCAFIKAKIEANAAGSATKCYTF